MISTSQYLEEKPGCLSQTGREPFRSWLSICCLMYTGMARLYGYIGMDLRPFYGYYRLSFCGIRIGNPSDEHLSTGGWRRTIPLALRKSTTFGLVNWLKSGKYVKWTSEIIGCWLEDYYSGGRSGTGGTPLATLESRGAVIPLPRLRTVYLYYGHSSLQS